ncbi:hypothetical protein JHK82_039647 [Glycine max]|nr:hypothetical protein JHK86_039838 [Glycine max]KAG4965444.1 hypothetical protein JHK85_040419 [Glycine max]KAG5110424.1 hypothetical protein JHK82_039647 [Glycine max]KAG5121709.1 hypothetical protein JHK84_040049 [Glycine max]
MTPSLASVFIINGRLFWGFDNDRNGVIVVAYFVDRNGTVTVAFAMVVIVHLASIVKPRLLLENDRDVLSMSQIELIDPEKEVHRGGPINEIGPVIEVHAMPINCSAENVAEAVAEECTQNGIEDMDVDGAKGGLDDENEVV